MGQTLNRMVCSECRKTGNDSKGDNLVEYLDDNGKPRVRCVRPECDANKKNTSSINVMGEFKDLTNRKISKETCELYNYQVGMHNGRPCHIANYYIKDEIKGQHIRYIDKKEFQWASYTQGLGLFGSQIKWDYNKPMILTEGQIDAMSCYEAGFQAMSIRGGIDTAVKSIEDHKEELLKYKKLILWFDSTDDGPKTTQRCLQLLPKGKTFWMNDKEFKDANEALLGDTNNIICVLEQGVQEYVPTGIVFGKDLDMESYLKPLPEGLKIGREVFDRKTRGYGFGQLYLFMGGCVDGDTEYFSREGWKKIKDYEEGEILQFNKDFSVSWVTPQEFHKYPCEEFNHFKTMYGLSQVLSDEHTFLYLPEDSKTIVKKPFSDIKPSLSASQFRGRVITAFKGIGQTGLDITDENLRVQIAVNADGYESNKNTQRTHVRVKRHYKIIRLRYLLQEAGIKYTEYLNKDGYTTFRFKSPWHKGFTAEYYKASLKQLQIIAEESLLWDGNRKNIFRSTKKIDADVIQYAWTSMNKKAALKSYVRKDKGHTEYVVQITDRKYVGMRYTKHKLKIVPSLDGYKYCFTVPSGMLVLRNNDCIFVTGNSGQGKSSIIRNDVLLLRRQYGVKIANYFLEDSARATPLAYIALDLGVPFGDFIHNPLKYCTKDKFRESWNKLIANDEMVFRSVEEDIDSQSFLDKIEYLAAVKEYKVIVLDHISLLIGAQKSVEGERRDIDIFLEKYYNLVLKYQFIGIIACQLSNPGQGKDWEEGREVKQSDARGSASLRFKPDVMIGIERNARDEYKKDKTQLRIIKNRWFGDTGLTDELVYLENTGRFVAL